MDFTYWYVLGTQNNLNIIKFTTETTSIGYFDGIKNVILDDISENIKSISQTGNYVAVSISYLTTMIYYVVNYLSKRISLQEENSIYGQVFIPIEPSSIAAYLKIMKDMANW